MNILYIAYSCNPYNGSEDKIGWNVPIESAKLNEKVYVVTKEEHREVISQYLKEHQINNIEFYFVDIPKVYKKIFSGFLYSGRLKIWNKRAFKIVRNLCSENKIDIIHQITPIEFRAIGDYEKIKGTKFIVGPIGGGEYIPKQLKEYAKKDYIIENIRKLINTYYKFKLTLNKKLSKCDYVIYANNETKEYLIGKNDNQDIRTEIGVEEKELYTKHNKNSKDITFIISGRVIYRKGHEFLLDAVEKIPYNFKYEIRIIGDGNKLEQIKNRVNKSENLREHVKILGKMQSFSQIYEEYDKADVLIMPSIRETTGTVILEGMIQGLPVITINKFGAVNIVNNENGFLYDGKTKEDMIENLKDIMIYCIENKEDVIEKSKNAKEDAMLFSFKNKVKYYNKVYYKLLEKGRI